MADPVILIISDATVALGDIPAGYPDDTDRPGRPDRFQVSGDQGRDHGHRRVDDDRPGRDVLRPGRHPAGPRGVDVRARLGGVPGLDGDAGISAWLFKNDATEKAFALYLDGEEDPSAVGRIVVVAGAFAGSPQTPLTFAVEMAIQGYPDIKDSAGASIRSAA